MIEAAIDRTSNNCSTLDDSRIYLPPSFLLDHRPHLILCIILYLIPIGIQKK